MIVQNRTKIIPMDELLTIKEASDWASKYLGKTVTTSNISYLIQYGRVKKIGGNRDTQVSKQELINYYKSYNGFRELSWKDQLGKDLNWALSFDQCAKHGKVCKPLFSILKWWETYTKDTVKRLLQFDRLRTNTFQVCLTGDSRRIEEPISNKFNLIEYKVC